MQFFLKKIWRNLFFYLSQVITCFERSEIIKRSTEQCKLSVILDFLVKTGLGNIFFCFCWKYKIISRFKKIWKNQEITNVSNNHSIHFCQNYQVLFCIICNFTLPMLIINTPEKCLQAHEILFFIFPKFSTVIR